MPWILAWWWMALAQASVGAPAAFVEGDTCVLTGRLTVQDGPDAVEREVPVGSRVRIVRPLAEHTDILVDGALVSADTLALQATCRSVGHEDASEGLSATEALKRAEQRFAKLRFAEVVPLLRGVLADESITQAQRARAYDLLGSSYAVMGYTIESETAFRNLLRLEPSYRLDAHTSPKISSVFERVAQESEALARQEAAARRAEMLAELKLALPDLDDVPGGQPLSFEVGVRDPRGVVEEARVFYRRRGEPVFASISLQRDVGGRWLGVLPAASLASKKGFVLEYYVATFDEADAELVSVGDERAPERARVLAGELPTTPVYQSVWFWTVVGGTAAAAALVVAGASVGAVLYGARANYPGPWVYVD